MVAVVVVGFGYLLQLEDLRRWLGGWVREKEGGNQGDLLWGGRVRKRGG